MKNEQIQNIDPELLALISKDWGQTTWTELNIEGKNDPETDDLYYQVLTLVYHGYGEKVLPYMTDQALINFILLYSEVDINNIADLGPTLISEFRRRNWLPNKLSDLFNTDKLVIFVIKNIELLPEIDPNDFVIKYWSDIDDYLADILKAKCPIYLIKL